MYPACALVKNYYRISNSSFCKLCMHHFFFKKKSYYAETLKLQKTINSVFHGPLIVQSIDNIVKIRQTTNSLV